jgi:lipopolysaccharide transport system ATP-binding protein
LNEYNFKRMSRSVIQVENVSKQYRLGKIGTGALVHDLNRWWHGVRGRQDPYLKVGDENDRTKKGNSGYVWALKNISLEVNQGDIVGIIGRNGAGKSTLLKILSRTTTPTSGFIKIKGRIASLLEVGTGFHPELTGKENVFLNGAILGMRTKEVRSKFDQIVNFAGVEKYIDTPVKRYSSGMYVRLAFAVAAHLDPEILVVDEVLAVGDAEFQKKALGKMNDVSKSEGRTVLFVSHNISSLRRLCVRGAYLNNGNLDFVGDIDSAVSRYMESGFNPQVVRQTTDFSILSVSFHNNSDLEIKTFSTHDDIQIKLTCNIQKEYSKVSFAIGFDNRMENRVMSLWSAYVGEYYDLVPGLAEITFSVSKIKLLPGEYFIHVYVDHRGGELVRVDKITKVTVSFIEAFGLVVEPKTSQGYYLEDFSINSKIKALTRQES